MSASGRGELKSPEDVRALLHAERAGLPFVFFRDAAGEQHIVSLGPAVDDIVVGRDEASDICLLWDPRVSGVHARLEKAGSFWTLHDDGLSRNGSFVNGSRVHGHRVLIDGDELCFGETLVSYRAGSAARGIATTLAVDAASAGAVSPAQRRVLVALCRPYKGAPSFARPATNQQIADELFLSIEAVKSHLRVLFARFGLEKLPANEKRMRLVEHALQSGLVQPHEL